MSILKPTKENIVHFVCLWLGVLFCLFSLVFFAVQGNDDKAFMSLISILYVFIPPIAQKLFKFHIQRTLYVFIAFYTVCPLLGFCYNFYYLIPWWDDILHAFAGVVFAMLGAYLPKIMSKNGEASLTLCVFSAFFFSVAIAGLWELVEFAMDSFFGTDMQKDTLITSMRPSYLLSELLGADVGVLEEIRDFQMSANGIPLPENTYVDLGLLDTMKDIFVETLGAAVYTVIYQIGKGKVFIFEHVGPWHDEPQPVVSASAPLQTETDVEAEAAPTEN